MCNNERYSEDGMRIREGVREELLRIFIVCGIDGVFSKAFHQKRKRETKRKVKDGDGERKRRSQRVERKNDRNTRGARNGK
jgi:hypothetical protein